MFWFLLIKYVFSSNKKTVIIYNLYTDRNESLNDKNLQLDGTNFKLIMQSTLPGFLSSVDLEGIEYKSEDNFIKKMNQKLLAYFISGFKYLKKNEKYKNIINLIILIINNTNFNRFDENILFYTQEYIKKCDYKFFAYFDIFIEALIESCNEDYQLMSDVGNYCSILCEIKNLASLKDINLETGQDNCYNYYHNISSNFKEIDEESNEKQDSIICIKYMPLMVGIMNNNLSITDNGYWEFLDELADSFAKMISIAFYFIKQRKLVYFNLYNGNQSLLFDYYMFKYNQTKLDILSFQEILVIIFESYEKFLHLHAEKFSYGISVIVKSEKFSKITSEMNEKIGKILSKAGYQYAAKKVESDILNDQNIEKKIFTTINQLSRKKKKKKAKKKSGTNNKHEFLEINDKTQHINTSNRKPETNKTNKSLESDNTEYSDNKKIASQDVIILNDSDSQKKDKETQSKNIQVTRKKSTIISEIDLPKGEEQNKTDDAQTVYGSDDSEQVAINFNNLSQDQEYFSENNNIKSTEEIHVIDQNKIYLQTHIPLQEQQKFFLMSISSRLDTFHGNPDESNPQTFKNLSVQPYQEGQSYMPERSEFYDAGNRISMVSEEEQDINSTGPKSIVSSESNIKDENLTVSNDEVKYYELFPEKKELSIFDMSQYMTRSCGNNSPVGGFPSNSQWVQKRKKN